MTRSRRKRREQPTEAPQFAGEPIGGRPWITREREYLSTTPEVGADAWNWSGARIDAYYRTMDRARAAFVRGFLAEEAKRRERPLAVPAPKPELFLSRFVAEEFGRR